MEIYKAHIDDLIENGYEFDVPKLISKGISFYFGNFLKILLTVLIGNLMPFISIITQINIYRGLREVDKKSGEEFNALFNFNKAGYILLYQLINVVFTIIYCGFFMFSFFVDELGYANIDSTSTFASTHIILAILLSVLYLIVYCFIFFCIPLFLFGEYTFSQSIKTSFQLVKKKFINVLFIILISGFLSILGFLFCYVGIFLSLPIMYSINYICYKEILFVEDVIEIQEIGKTYTN